MDNILRIENEVPLEHPQSYSSTSSTDQRLTERSDYVEGAGSSSVEPQSTSTSDKPQADPLTESDKSFSTVQQATHPPDHVEHAKYFEEQKMDIDASALEQRANPRRKDVLTPGDDPTGYGQFCVVLQSLLNRSQSETLATWFGYPPAKIDSIKISDNPSTVLVQLMDARGEISPTDISRLINALESHTISLHGVARKIKEAFSRSPSNDSLTTSTYGAHDKIVLLVKQLKSVYRNLCAKIRPVPFRHEKFNIAQIFVESELQFIQRGTVQQTLTSYTEIFTNEKCVSKRRIITGDPGFGKSTLALQIANDWVKGDDESSMKHVQILILLRLRELNNLSSFYTAIKALLLPRDTTLTEHDLRCILSRSARVVIILDGYDEFPEKGQSRSDIESIIRGQMFLDFEVILLTRTSCQPLDVSHDTILIRMTGFNNASRDAYIQKVVAYGETENADKIRKFVSEKLAVDLYKVPLLFAMISHMADKMDKFRNMKSIADFFRHAVECFRVHGQIKEMGDSRGRYVQLHEDHSALEKTAFESLTTMKFCWRRESLRQKIGGDLYDKYVQTGILIEEDVYNFDDIGYRRETRFCHKMFMEWFAAQHVVREATRNETDCELWFESLGENGKLQTPTEQKIHILKNLNPRHVEYMFRFACGLNVDAGRKVILHLVLTGHPWQTLLMFITEWGGSLDSVLDILPIIGKNSIVLNGDDCVPFQERTIECLNLLSKRKVIPLAMLELQNCLDLSSLSTGNISLESGLSLPVTETLTLLILDFGVMMSKEEVGGILKYATKCKRLKKMTFGYCLLPRYMDFSECLPVLRWRYVTVFWHFGARSHSYCLDFESGEWRNEANDKLCNSVEYSIMAGEILPLHMKDEGNRRRKSRKLQE
ncbi:NLR family CARD domain-containing protein 4 [Holothuria leucospilota]|uniref:NLR family CARD domain-containing protein 4 n=1 Tax=Holothuria leucospilota TaxID=206669 RepID=A0A9Q1CPB2_HOLLE|nr:NLR family CARD domain-containing protein 4 [Holothuria leucospilota]